MNIFTKHSTALSLYRSQKALKAALRTTGKHYIVEIPLTLPRPLRATPATKKACRQRCKRQPKHQKET